MFDTAYEETGSDEALADFNDDGLAEIAVGRIPSKTGAEIAQILNKESFLSKPQRKDLAGAFYLQAMWRMVMILPE